MRGSGQALGKSERSYFEPRFGRDFNDVRVHTGPKATVASRDINARAFTVGNDVFFGEGEYQPSSHVGRKLIAHELTHTIQQGAGKKSTTINRYPVDKNDPNAFQVVPGKAVRESMPGKIKFRGNLKNVVDTLYRHIPGYISNPKYASKKDDQFDYAVNLAARKYMIRLIMNMNNIRNERKILKDTILSVPSYGLSRRVIQQITFNKRLEKAIEGMLLNQGEKYKKLSQKGKMRIDFMNLVGIPALLAAGPAIAGMGIMFAAMGYRVTKSGVFFSVSGALAEGLGFTAGTTYAMLYNFADGRVTISPYLDYGVVLGAAAGAGIAIGPAALVERNKKRDRRASVDFGNTHVSSVDIKAIAGLSVMVAFPTDSGKCTEYKLPNTLCYDINKFWLGFALGIGYQLKISAQNTQSLELMRPINLGAFPVDKMSLKSLMEILARMKKVKKEVRELQKEMRREAKDSPKGNF